MKAKTINDLLGREVTNKDYYNVREIVIADNVENIYPFAFSKFRKLNTIVVSDSVKIIETRAFSRCRQLKSLIISKSVETINELAFSGCYALESIVVNSQNKIYDSRDDCNAIIRSKDNALLFGCKGTTIPNGVKRIDPCAFLSGSYPPVIRIPESLHVFSVNAFKNVLGIEVDPNNSTFDSRDNCNAIIRKKNNSLIFGCENSVIPNGIEIIGYRAFDGQTGLTSVVIPETVKCIGDSSFRGCTSLTSVTIENGVESIMERAFQDCGRLEEIVIPGSVKDIYSKAFYGCVSLSTVTISEGVKVISEGAFSACCSLVSIYLPASIILIVESAFQYCKNLQRIVVPKGCKGKYEKFLPENVDKIVEQ